MRKTVNNTQHGGSHYKAEYQHWDLICDLRLDYYTANATKYITRHRKKNGREDALKAKHYVDKLIELIGENRMPAPYCHTHLEWVARNEMLNIFYDENDIDPAGLDANFIVHTIHASSVDDLKYASTLAQQIADSYPVAPATPKTCLMTNFPVEVAKVLEPNFAPEGYWGDGNILWKCLQCGNYFKAADGILPSTEHKCEHPSDPTPAYVDQARDSKT